MRFLPLLVAAAVAAAWHPDPASACGTPIQPRTRMASALRAVADTQPPSAIPSAWVSSLVNDYVEYGYPCSWVNTIGIGLEPPSDDVTPQDQIGYVIESTEITIDLQPGDLLLAEQHELLFNSLGPMPKQFHLSLTPVDLARNRGATYELDVANPGATTPPGPPSGDDSAAGAGSTGCSQSGSGRSATLIPLALLVLACLAASLRRPTRART